jgi:hypothetical protein
MWPSQYRQGAAMISELSAVMHPRTDHDVHQTTK